MKKKSKKKRRSARKIPVAIAREAVEISAVWIRRAIIGFPLEVGASVATGTTLGGEATTNLLSGVANGVLGVFDGLGPVYGKVGQIALSRVPAKWAPFFSLVGLDRLYGQWPPLSFKQVAAILDKEIPGWREELEVENAPIGVASVAQVHAAVDREGREWVIKIVKPQARKRMSETVDALEEAADIAAPVAITAVAKRSVRELRTLAASLRAELDLRQELETLVRVREKLASRKQQVLRIPEAWPEYSSKQVLTLERFHGTNLARVVSGEVQLNQTLRKKLARKMLQELLIQVFEVGLFHADPHAGNLILLEDGSLGLFDWGLSGELMDADRKHIAGMLKAIMAMDLEKVIDVLEGMAAEAGRTCNRDEIKKALGKLKRMITNAKSKKKKVALHELIESALNSAENLGIPVPNGLLMMAKSLITIEGLAKGIDPEVSMARIATPVLFRAAQPTWKDIVNLTMNLSAVAKKAFS